MTMTNSLQSYIEIINLLRRKEKDKTLCISESYRCQICKQILRIPYQTHCGCIFCKDCIDSWLRDNKYCPGSGDECKSKELTNYKGIKEDKARAKDILKLRVKCISDECDVIVEVNRLMEHLEKCERRKVKCDICMEDVTRININCHKEKECPERKIKCRNSVNIISGIIFDNEHITPEHKNVCKDGFCTNSCGTKEPVNIFKHQKSCVNKTVDCSFQKFGCQTKNLCQGMLQSHINDNLYFHTMMMVTYIRGRENQVKKLKHSIVKLDQDIYTLESEIKSVEKRYDDDKPSIDSLRICNPGNINDDDNDDHIIWRDGTFLWKVENFEHFLSESKSCIISKAFYSSDFGYKLCLKMYPCGDGTGQGSYISLFAVIMKGKYDNILKWPFCNKIKLSLLAFSNTSVEHSEILKPDTTPQCYAQPKTKYNVGFGHPKFMAHKNLFKDFMLDNKIFIKVLILNES